MGGTPGRFEAAFGADKSGAVLADEWEWTDLSSRTQDSEAVITRGRMAQQQQVNPATLPMLLDNGDGALTPRHPASTYYPNVVKGVPVRHSVQVGDPYLYCTGGGASATTPDVAALDVTGDLTVIVEVLSPVRYRPIPNSAVNTESTTGHLAQKWTPTGNQRSWRFGITAAAGSLYFTWSEDGVSSFGFFSAPLPKPAQGPYALAASLDVDNGAGGWTGRLYRWEGSAAELIANADDALFLEFPYDVDGTTSIFSSSAPLEIGGGADATLGRYTGGISEARVLSGDLTTGTAVANPDFTAETAGTTGFTDAAGRTWTVGSTAEITDWRPRFYGELAGAYPSWPGASAAGTAQIRWDTAGILRRLRQHAKPPQSAMRRSLGRSSFVIAYWPLDDGQLSETASNAIEGGPPMTTAGSIQWASATDCPGSDPVIAVSENQGFGFLGSVPESATAPTHFRVEWFVKVNTVATSPAETALMVVGTNGSIRQMVVGANTSSIFVRAKDAFGATTTTVSSSALSSNVMGYWTYFSLRIEQIGFGVEMVLDWIPLEGPGQGGAFQISGTSGFQTYDRVVSVGTLATALGGGISYGNVIVARDVEFGWLANADTGWESESATQRFHRLCREEGIVGYLDGPYGTLTTGLDEGVASMGPQRTLPFLSLLEECAVADFGYLGEDYATGGLTYRTGATLVNQTPTLTLTDEVTRDLAPADDDQGLINDLTVSRIDGSSFRTTDDDSIAASGTYEGRVDVNLNEDTDLVAQAGLRLSLATWPEMRYGSLPIELSKNEALWEAWCRIAPGDLIAATALPDTHPSATIRQLLDGYVETISAVRWHVKANVTPEGPWAAGAIDTDGTPDTDAYSIDTDGSELASAIDSDDLSASVSVTAGELWTTDAAQFPLDVEIGGEVVTLSAISGASSPQTFTISARSVNGIVKSHSAGATVRVAHPIRPTI